ncbi:MAG: hypothetical protein RL701_4731 [Pseudomonadota bacterium]|jgi:putative salt-induced outer membrane protein YdiY
MNVRGPALPYVAVCLLWAVSLATSPALAQPADLTLHAEKAATAPFQADVTTFNLSAGGSLNTGNTKAMLLNLGSAFALVRDRHGLGLTMDFAYGRANLPDDTTAGFVDTVRNLRTRGRYDFFLTPMDALFLAGSYRWDTFAGLDARMQGQIGYMRNLFKEEQHRFWGELGYDLTYDNYDPDPLPNLPADTPDLFLKGYAYVHSARAYVGYENQLNAAVSVVTGLEGLLNVERPEDFRLNWDIAVRSSIVSRLQFELRFSLQLDTEPVPGKNELDTQTRANLIYTLI